MSELTIIPDGRFLPDPSTVEMPSNDFGLMDEYVESTISQLEELEVLALAYEQGDNLTERAAAIRRVLHKIKGESGMVGFHVIELIVHSAEDGFEQLPQAQRADMLLKLKDWICAVLESCSN